MQPERPQHPAATGMRGLTGKRILENSNGSREETESDWLESNNADFPGTNNGKWHFQFIKSDVLSKLCLGLFSQLYKPHVNYAHQG